MKAATCGTVGSMTAETRARDTMTPAPSALTQVLPTATLNERGRPLGALRDDLYRIPNVANACHVVGVWVQSVGVLALAAWWGNPIGWVAAFLLMGRAFARFSILGHEAAHRLLFSNRKVNDWVGKWLVAYPAFVPLDIYRRGRQPSKRRSNTSSRVDNPQPKKAKMITPTNTLSV